MKLLGDIQTGLDMVVPHIVARGICPNAVRSRSDVSIAPFVV